MQQQTGNCFVSAPAKTRVDDPGHQRFEQGIGRVIGSSAAMRRLFPLCRRLAESTLPLVIEGETGTGKELLAESLHELGPRADRPFVVLDCTSIPKNLVESALFGHEKGSFTGATEARRGVFEEANGGTLLLDEIGDLDFDLQAKLLRALERSEIQRVGSTKRIKVNVRFMAATRRDLADMVRDGRFRDDLYFRLAVTRIELPPLRDRSGDVRRLAQAFWHRLRPDAPLPPALLNRLERSSWPGNVRELQNNVARYAALGDLAWTRDGGPREPVPSLPGTTRPPEGTAHDAAPSLDEHPFTHVLEQGLSLPDARKAIVRAFERSYIERALEQSAGSVSKAAEASGVGARYFRMIRARSGERDAKKAKAASSTPLVAE